MSWPGQWESQMGRVNRQVNLIPYVADATRYKRDDFWTGADGEGSDCEDYALAKLRRLHGIGWPIETLHLACCYTEHDEYHAVLVVDTPHGAFILDNRMEIPVSVGRLAELAYKPDVIQAVGGAKEWKQWLA